MDAPTRQLAHTDPELGRLITRVGPLPPRSYDYADPYQALIFAISHQQLHAKAADAVLGRLKEAHHGAIPAPDALMALPDSSLRSYGYSATKIRALKDVAAKALDGTIPSLTAAQQLGDNDLIERLTKIRGVGRWTVEMLLIFALKRPDILPVDDFGVREGYRLLHRLPVQPTPKALRQIGLAYAPYRSLVTLYLWHLAGEAKAQKARR